MYNFSFIFLTTFRTNFSIGMTPPLNDSNKKSVKIKETITIVILQQKTAAIKKIFEKVLRNRLKCPE